MRRAQSLGIDATGAGSFGSGTLLLPMMRRLIGTEAVITRMPESKRLILNWVCRMPVVAPGEHAGRDGRERREDGMNAVGDAARPRWRRRA